MTTKWQIWLFMFAYVGAGILIGVLVSPLSWPAGAISGPFVPDGGGYGIDKSQSRPYLRAISNSG